MLWKLQRSTLIPVQILGYALGIFIALGIILTALQFYTDLKPVLGGQTDVFRNNTAVISKNVSLFKTLNTSGVYFTNKEIDELKAQSFVAQVAPFNNSGFEVMAYTTTGENIPLLQTELFFESIPDQYLDVESDDWKWDLSQKHIPIIIPEDYLNLYNFGYAESQGLPVFSKNTITRVNFNIRLSGNGLMESYKGNIVGFSGKINSILVPEDFLQWANERYGRARSTQPNRLMVEFSNPTDEAIMPFFSDNNYSISKEKLEMGKIVFMFRTAFGFVFAIALIIAILSVAFVFLSFRLIFEKNRELIRNLFNMGYGEKRIALFYQLLISIITLLSVAGSVVISLFIRDFYLEKLQRMIEFDSSSSLIILVGAGLLVFLLIVYNVVFPRTIRRIANGDS